MTEHEDEDYFPESSLTQEDKDYIQSVKNFNKSELDSLLDGVESEHDMWDHYHSLYHDKYIHNANGEAICQVFVEKATDEFLRISIIEVGKPLKKVKPIKFANWLRGLQHTVSE